MPRSKLLNTVVLTRLVGALLITLASTSGSLAQSAKERVLEEGKIVIGIHNRAPWGYRDEASGEPAGWHPEIIEAVFGELGVEEVELRVTEFGALIPGLLAGRFDAVASGLAITPERCEQVSFGDPDLKVPDAAVVLSGNPKQIHGYGDIAAKEDVIMGAGRGSVVAKNAMEAGVPEGRILLFPDVESNISGLRAGRTDVAIFSSPTVIGLLSGDTTIGLERAEPFETSDDQANYAAVAFRKEDSELREIYNQRLAELKADGTIARIMDEYGFGEPEAVPAGMTTKKLCGFGG